MVLLRNCGFCYCLESTDMTTAKEREAAFRAALAILLTEHGAELHITDDGKPYGMHTAIVQISMSNRWDATGNQTHEYTEFLL